ncbi:molybdate ABC transporter substrate-binding protein [Acidomonas methanolica]|uniref:ABC transporter molybdenum permease n=1 Tax=Acidomonas methanolica NBRC 104435 TaxID=1231351 RepID=A0A023D856_ACIMT|nr:molybdate ABC transporter substrate-binding protein [Acidomonas methanolica]TCS30941.1 molybdate transport system substrate-binding protein [Acidomonas methanolica]GAJ29930.1 ABC transporter molybdenum permease [Acidomonas methanolica NBRC 104435]GBQ56424.1 molybdate ABC transporter substrate-binding periplasmic protein [Acidomonas methanolica]GEK98261.1 molybdate ABC transporter substrate-binding protein [Acidomonas methanolica NBRC 104435]
MKWRAMAVLALMAGATGAGAARAETARVAIAANFIAPAKVLIVAYDQASGNDVQASFGSSGQFLTQIRNGAPFDAFLSADAARPDSLLKAHLAVSGSGFTYAVGTLVLWSGDAALPAGEAVLRSGRFAHLAICNPALAPYGAAAVEAMRKLGVYDALEPRLVVGADVAQAWQFARSGSAELGFVAYSQVKAAGNPGSVWVVPETLYAPIHQDAVLLAHGEGNAAAKGFLAYLKTPAARAVIARYGYGK